MATDAGRIDRALSRLLEHGSRLQGPAVDKYVWHLRRANPADTPAQIISRMETLFLRAVTGSGGAAGAAAAVPGIGTVASVGAIGAETVFFLEASALLTLAVASVHGIPIDDQEARKALVLAVALGESGREVVARTNPRAGRTAGADIAGLAGINKRLLTKFVTKFAAKRGAVSLGTMLPVGIGAVVGGAGNRMLGKGVIRHAREAFGEPPRSWATAPGVIEHDEGVIVHDRQHHT